MSATRLSPTVVASITVRSPSSTGAYRRGIVAAITVRLPSSTGADRRGIVAAITVCPPSSTGADRRGIVAAMIYRPPPLLAALEEGRLPLNLVETEHQPSLQFLESLHPCWMGFHVPKLLARHLDFHWRH
jgi:hypothetical protein